MARPQFLQELTKGKILCGKTAPDFVETFNYTARRCDNLCGDADLNPESGKITVDNTNPEHPVIRIKGGEAATRMVTPCELDVTNNKLHFVYVHVEDSLWGKGESLDVPAGNGIIALKIDPTTENIECNLYSTWADYNNKSKDTEHHYLPLYYKIDRGDGKMLIVDLRVAPFAQSWIIGAEDYQGF